MPKTQESRYRFVIECLVLLERCSIGLNFFAPATVLSLIMDDFHVDRATAGMVMSAPPLMMVACLVPGSLLSARFGIKPTYGLGGLLMAAGILVPFTHDLFSLIVLRIIFGIGASLVAPQGPSIVARWFPPRQLPVVNGANTLMNNLAVALTMASGAFLSVTIGWRSALAVYAALPLVFSILWMLLAREAPAGAEVLATRPRFGDMAAMLKRRPTLLLGFLYFGQWGQNVALSSWLPVYYHRVMGFSLSSAGFMVSLMPLFGILGAILGGYLPVRLGLRRPLLIGPGGFLMLFALVAILAPIEWLIPVSIAALGVLGCIYLPSAMTLPLELPGISPKQAGVTLAAAYSLGNIGSFLAPVMVGFLADQTSSYVPGLAVAATLSLSLVISGYLLPETGPRATGARLRTEGAE